MFFFILVILVLFHRLILQRNKVVLPYGIISDMGLLSSQNNEFQPVCY